VGILDGNDNLQYSFTWGMDLSGSLQGAGGVGGLLSMTVYAGTNAGAYFYSYDGNGNVAAMVNAAKWHRGRQSEYDPFGNLLRTTGPLGKDRASEQGGINLYGFVLNTPISYIDYLGNKIVTYPGHAIVDDDRHIIYVDTGTIVILYGHATENDWTWHFHDGPCNAGASIMCWPISNSSGIPDGKNRYTALAGGGALNGLTGVWGYPDTGNDLIHFFNNNDQYVYINNAKALNVTAMGARETANKILKSKKCHVNMLRLYTSK
jgi:hypothetical protein